MINFPISLIRRVHGRITTFETVGVELFVSAIDWLPLFCYCGVDFPPVAEDSTYTTYLCAYLELLLMSVYKTRRYSAH